MLREYVLLTLKPDSETFEVEVFKREPPFSTLQSRVGGFVESVPHLNSICHGGKTRRVMAFCNEEGQINNLPFNDKATRLWLENLGDGPFSYEPRIYGNLVLRYSRVTGEEG
jgi:hypothetical protein